MSMIVGLQNTEFTTKDGHVICGTKVFLTEKIPEDRGAGVATDSIFISKAKSDALSFPLAVGDEILVYYNKYGRIQDIKREDVEIDY